MTFSTKPFPVVGQVKIKESTHGRMIVRNAVNEMVLARGELAVSESGCDLGLGHQSQALFRHLVEDGLDVLVLQLAPAG